LIAQVLGTGLNIGTISLDQIIPVYGQITPLVADLGVMRSFAGTKNMKRTHTGLISFNGRATMANRSWAAP
jgi:hypothetical protein